MKPTRVHLLSLFISAWLILSLNPTFVLAQATTAAHTEKPVKFIYNSDGSHLFYGEKRPEDLNADWPQRTSHRKKPMTVEDLLAPVDEVANSQVDTFLVCPISYQVVTYRSKIEKRLGDDATQQQLEATSNNLRNTVEALREFDRLGVDPYKLVIDRAREKGMRPMVTWRVQQAHVISGTERSIALSPFVDAHPELRIKGASGGDGESSLDFAAPQVRARKIDLIREFVSMYGVDGCDLDFQRFPLFFVRGKEAAGMPLMTEFVRGVRAVLDEEGKKAGKRMVLGVRIPETPERCAKLGLAPADWVNAGLVDYVVVSTFLNQNRTLDGHDMPALDPAAFRKSFARPVPILGCLQLAYMLPNPETKKFASYRLGPEDYRREAARMWHSGFDGIEVFNFFMHRAFADERIARCEPPLFLLRELGDAKTIGQIHSPEEDAWRKIYSLKPIPEESLKALQLDLALP